jgi:hypothetical protein
MTNKCVKELVGFTNVFQIYPDMFRQVVTIFRGRRYPRSYSSNICIVGVYGLRSVQCGQLSWSEDGNHLPKHVVVNLEYINKSASSLTHFLVILR